MSWLHTLIAFIANHPHEAYGAVFLCSFLESLAIVGLIIPGTTIIFGFGALVGAGSLSLPPVLICACIGAVAGDGISYWLGRHYRGRVATIRPFSSHPGGLRNGETFFLRFGGKSILFGRFFGPVRAFIPLVAGMMGMRPLLFTIVNILSAVGWAFAFVMPGVLFGSSLATAGAVSARLVVLLLIVLGAVWGVVWIARRLVLFVGNHWSSWRSAAKVWSETPGRRTIRPVKRAVSFFFLRQEEEEMFLGFLVLLMVIAGWGFLAVLHGVLALDPLVLADEAVYHFFQSLRTPWTDYFFVAVTECGDSFVNIAVAAAVLLVLLLSRCRRVAALWMVSFAGGLAGIELLKWVIQGPRPVALYHGISAYGFPSGHTTMSLVLYGFLAVLIARGLRRTARWWLFAAVVTISFMISLSRLYLGAHWMSDVLGGYFIGTSWVALLGIIYLKEEGEPVPRRWLVLVTVLVVTVIGGWHISRQHRHDLVRYAVRHTVATMSIEQWRSGGWRELPAWRIDLAGQQEQPLTFQWAGSCEDLSAYLMAHDWERPPSLNLKTMLGILAPGTPIQHIPVLPRLHDGRENSLSLVRLVGDRRWVLRLWPSDIAIESDSTRVYQGSVEIENRRRIAGFIILVEYTGDYDSSIDAVGITLAGRFNTQSVNREGMAVQRGKDRSRPGWDGRVLLVWGK